MIRSDKISRAALCFAVVASLLLNAALGWAKGTVSLRLDLREEYNDNIFLTPTDEESDFITIVEPVVSATLETRPANFFLDYGARLRFYREFSEEDETSLRDAQRALARADILPERDFSLFITDEFSRVTIDPRRPSVEEVAAVNQSNRNRLRINPRYRWRSNPALAAILNYEYENDDYQAPEGDDTDSHRVTLDLIRRPGSRFQILVGGSFQDTEADNNRDYRLLSGYAGFLWKPAPSLSFGARGGITKVDFREEPDAGMPGIDGHRSAVWEVDGGWEKGRFVARLDYTRAFTTTVSLGLSESQRGAAALGYRGRMTWELSVYTEEEEYLESDRRDRATGSRIVFGVPLGRFLRLSMHGEYARLKFDPDDEEGDRYGAGAELAYEHRYLTLALGGLFRERSSNIELNDYRNRIVYLQGGWRF